MKFRSAPKSELVLAMLRNSAVLVKREKLTAEDAEDRAEALRKLAFWGTPLPRFSGISDLASNCEMIYGVQ